MYMRLLLKYRHVPTVPRLYTRTFTSCTLLRQYHQPTNKFEILLTQILSDPNAVRDSFIKLRDMHGDEKFNEKVTNLFYDHFKDSPYNLSIFQCLINSPNLTQNVNDHLWSLLSKKKLSDSEKFESLNLYLTTLNRIVPPNQFDHKIKLNVKVEKLLLEVTPKLYYKELFMLLLNLNYDIRNGSLLSKLTYKLRCGSSDDLYTFLNARLPTEEPKNDPQLLMKRTYTYSMFADVLRIYTRLNASQNFSKVISLMFQKVEEDDQTRVPRTLLVSRAYEFLMSHILGKNGLKPSLLILQDMQNNDIPISNRMLMILLNRLVNDSDLKNFAILTNYILRLHQKHGQEINHTTVQVITNQMLRVIQRSKYSHADLNVIVGYTLSFFKESNALLNELGISDLVYGDNTDPSSFLIADISDQLQLLKYPPMTSLEQVYIALFRYMNFNKTMTLTILEELYVKYRDAVINVQKLEKADKSYIHHPFSYENMNDKILKLFMRQFMFRFSSFEGAAYLLEDFTKHIHLKYLLNSYMYDLVIKYYLKKDDLFTAFEWFDKLTNEYDVPVTYGTLTQLIVKSYDLNSENSRSISSRLIRDHLVPLVRANVFKFHLSKQLKSIVDDLELMHLFDMKLIDEKPEISPNPKKASDKFDLEEEFDDTLIESCAAENIQYLDNLVRNDSATDQATTTVPKEVIQKLIPFEVEEKDDDQIFDTSDMESSTELLSNVPQIPKLTYNKTLDKKSHEPNFDSIQQAPVVSDNDKMTIEISKMYDTSYEQIFKTSDMRNGNGSSKMPSNMPQIPKLVYDESLDKKLHQLNFDSNEQTPDVLDADEMISEISKMSPPSYESTARQGDSLFKKKKQFMQMLQNATNDDLVILLISFLKRNEDRIIFFKSNTDYRNFYYTESHRKV